MLDTQAAAEFVDCEFTGNEGTGLSQPTCRRPNPADCFKPLCDYLLFTTYITSALFAHTVRRDAPRACLFFAATGTRGRATARPETRARAGREHRACARPSAVPGYRKDTVVTFVTHTLRW